MGKEPRITSTAKNCASACLTLKAQPNKSLEVRAKQLLSYLACLLNFNLRGFGFAPRYLSRSTAFLSVHCINKNKQVLSSPYLWSGSLFLWSDQSFYIGAASDSIVHATHDVTVCVATRGSFRLQTSAGWQEFQAVIIPPDLPHIFDGRGARLVLFYFPSEVLKLQRLFYCRCEPYPVPQKMLSRFLPVLRHYSDNGCESEEATEFCEDFTRELSRADFPRMTLDSRVALALECFQTDPTHRFTAAEISSEVNLSESRFAHLFREQIGIPVRRYLLELRLRRALLEIAHGKSLTTGAYAADFADSAHLSRTFRRMTGIAPSSILKHSRIVPSQK